MIKFKPLLVVAIVLAAFAAFFTLSALFPQIMFFVVMSVALIALCIATYRIADTYYSETEEE